MIVTVEQRRGFARYLALRLPSWEDRATVARNAGIPTSQITGEPLQVWQGLVDDAVEADRLDRLLSAAAERLGGDRALVASAEAARDGVVRLPGRGRRVIALAVGAAVLLGVGALVVVGAPDAAVGDVAVADASSDDEGPAPAASDAPGDGSPVEDPGRAAVAAGTTSDERGPAPASAPPTEPASPEPVTDRAAAPSEPVPARVAEPAPEAPPADAGPSSASAPPPGPTSAPGVCDRPEGQVVGYTYAGMAPPDAPGDVWELAVPRNVRAAFPSRDNGYDTRSEVVCVLPQGARLRLVERPVRVEGGAWWVPVVGGSVSR